MSPASKRLMFPGHGSLFVITVIMAGVIYCQFQFWKQPTQGDWSMYDYIAQVIARGGVPYRDAVDIKSPLSMYIGAAAIKIAEPFGVRDLIAIRITYLILAMLTAGLTFLVAHDYFKSRRIGLLAAMIMFAFDSFGSFNNFGIQSKTPMILFGLLVLWAILKQKPFLAGSFSMLSALTWQPGLLFAGVAGLAFSRYLTNLRDRKVIMLLIAAAIPLTVLLLYFWIAGALRDFYLWCFQFAATVYGPGEIHTPGHFIQHFTGIINYGYAGEIFYFLIAAAGLAVFFVRELRLFMEHGTKAFLDHSCQHAIWIAPLIYFLFCMVNIQGAPDIIPLLPFVAIYCASLVVSGIDWTARRLEAMLPRSGNTAFAGLAFAAVIVLIFFVSVADAFRTQLNSPTLHDQDQDIKEILSHMDSDEKIFVHGQTELLVLSRLTNSSKYFLLDHGKDTYLNYVEPGGFYGWFDRLKAEQPKLIGLSRLRRVDHGAEIEQWVRDNYEHRNGKIFSYYLRKD